MTRNITLSADDSLIARARELAASRHQSLNQVFREWLERYVAEANAAENYRDLMDQLSNVEAGAHFDRDSMNER